MPDRSSMSLKIAETRKLKGITQEELADQAGVTVRTIQRLESGENTARAFTLKAIAGVLGLELSELTGSQVAAATSTAPGQDAAGEEQATDSIILRQVNGDRLQPGDQRSTAETTADQTESEAYFMRVFVLSCFSFIVVPYIHFLIPMHLLKNRITLSRRNLRLAKRIILAQIVWVIALNLVLLLTLVANLLLAKSSPGRHISYLLVTGIMYGVNLVILCFTLLRPAAKTPEHLSLTTS